MDDTIEIQISRMLNDSHLQIVMESSCEFNKMFSMTCTMIFFSGSYKLEFSLQFY